jgi:cytosine/adenosine deaminase-related metal-dependent hydrolase
MPFCRAGGKFTINQSIILYRKFTSPYIFTGYNLLPAGNVLITDNKGVFTDIVSLKDAGDGIEYFDGIISPGFINAHCHLELSHLKARIPEKTGLVEFVFKIITERHFAEAEILSAIETAEGEMLQNGIVAVGDICNTVHTIAQKKQQQLRYHNFVEVAGFVPAGAQARFDAALETCKQFNAATPRPTTNDQRPTSIVPHASYSVSPELFHLINDHPGNNLLTIHNQETIAEEQFFKERSGDFLKLYEKLNIDISFFKASGKSSLQSWWPNFTKGQSLILVHDVTTTKEDIECIKLSTKNNQLTTAFCLCPNANLYITNQLPDVKMLMQEQCNIVLGTDSLASNHQLSILEEMKTLQQHFPEIQTTSLLQWATLNGAKALQMDDTLGSFEKGKQPGVVLIEGIQNSQFTASSSSKKIV